MAKQRTGDEHIVFNGMPTEYSLSDYWRWNASDLLNNTLRGSYCEFIVSAALGIDLSGTNDDWTPYDISFPYNWEYNGEARDEVRIEVKSGAYLQAWWQGDGRLSNIQFSIRPTRAWDSINGYAEEVKRQSDVYVFCLYTCASVPTRWCWMDGTSTSYRLIFWTNSVAPKRPSLSPCYKSWSHTALTMAASEMPLSIRWMCTLPLPTICIILSVLFCA